MNEKGYDVVTKNNERISVKTTTRIVGRVILFIPGMPGTLRHRTISEWGFLFKRQSLQLGTFIIRELIQP